MTPNKFLIFAAITVLFVFAFFLNAMLNETYALPDEESKSEEIEVEESKPIEDKKHEFNMISYTVELTYWDGRKDTVTYKYVRDVFELTIRDGNLRCTRTDDEDVNGDGHEDFISSKNLRTLQYGTGVLSFRILAADIKLTNNI